MELGALAVIRIGIDPNIINTGQLVVSWHGFFTALGILAVLLWARRQGKRYGIDEDAVYGTAIWAILGGIVGARLIHVIDYWSYYSADPLAIVQVWGGGIGLIGGVLGASIGASVYAWRNRYPLGRMVDLVAPGALLGQFIGRIGDIINGEHLARLSNQPWAVQYTHPSSPGFGQGAMHPAIGYEMLWDVAMFFVVYRLIDRLRPDGMVFFSYLALYAFGRFFIQFLRRDSVWFAGLQEAHVLTLGIMLVSVVFLASRARFARAGVGTSPR